MAEISKIEWTDSTWTPIRARRIAIANDGSGKELIGWHCEHVSPGCKHCYAEGMNLRLGTGLEFKPANLKHKTRLGDDRGDVSVFLDAEMLMRPLHWKRPRMIFVCSMTDIFADFVKDEWLDQMFAVMALAPRHTFQVLTKRAERMHRYLSDINVKNRIIGHAWNMLGYLPKYKHEGILQRPWPLPNVWLGVSAENQEWANIRVPLVLQTPAAVRFISAEPLLGLIDLERPMPGPDLDQGGGAKICQPWYIQSGIDWVIVGGESGHRARPMHPDWVRSLRDQCAAAGVPFLFKQWGEWAPGECAQNTLAMRTVQTADWFVDEWRFKTIAGDSEFHIDDEPTVYRAGKKAAGRLLDGVQHDGFPEVRNVY